MTVFIIISLSPRDYRSELFNVGGFPTGRVVTIEWRIEGAEIFELGGAMKINYHSDLQKSGKRYAFRFDFNFKF